MKYLKIQNDGLLDIRLIFLMGGTTKTGKEFKIGQFGTGLKYTLAYLLRENIDFKIFIGGEEIKIKTQRERICDTDFEIILINDQKSSITTMIGKDWEAWMIIRELWCNALDELNPKVAIVSEIQPGKNTTEFYIQLTGQIADVWDNWDNYFIHEKKPLQNEKDFAIYPGGDGLRIYKNGVLIRWDKNQTGVFMYDLKNAKINELREYNGILSLDLIRIFPKFNKEVVDIFISCVKGKFEEKMDYDWTTVPFGDGWKEALGNAKFIDYETYDKLRGRFPELMNEPIVQVPKGLFNKLHTYFPAISMLAASDISNAFVPYEHPNLMSKINICVETLRECGYTLHPDLSFQTGIFSSTVIQGRINIDTKICNMSIDLDNMSLSDIITIIIEENEHLMTGYNDCTREFQNHLLKMFQNQLFKNQKS